MKPSLLYRSYQFVSQAKKQWLFSAFGYVSHCRHKPSCGQYAMEQLSEHGTILGTFKALLRLVTCW